jgi:hypothetical protein
MKKCGKTEKTMGWNGLLKACLAVGDIGDIQPFHFLDRKRLVQNIPVAGTLMST